MTADRTPPLRDQIAEALYRWTTQQAAATRPDIDRYDLQRALSACHSAGWTWGRTMTEAVRMLARGEEPLDLIHATEDPLKLRRNLR